MSIEAAEKPKPLVVLWDTDVDGKRHHGNLIHGAANALAQRGSIELITIAAWSEFTGFLGATLKPRLESGSWPSEICFLIHAGENRYESLSTAQTNAVELAFEEIVGAPARGHWKQFASARCDINILVYSGGGNWPQLRQTGLGSWVGAVQCWSPGADAGEKIQGLFEKPGFSERTARFWRLQSQTSPLSASIHELCHRTAPLRLDLDLLASPLGGAAQEDLLSVYAAAIGSPSEAGYLFRRRGGWTLESFASALLCGKITATHLRIELEVGTSAAVFPRCVLLHSRVAYQLDAKGGGSLGCEVYGWGGLADAAPRSAGAGSAGTETGTKANQLARWERQRDDRLRELRSRLEEVQQCKSSERVDLVAALKGVADWFDALDGYLRKLREAEESGADS